MSQKFHIGDVLGLYTRIIISGSRDIGKRYPFQGVSELASYLAGEPLFELQVLDMRTQMAAHLEQQFPWLKTVEQPNFSMAHGKAAITVAIDAYQERQAALYGEWLTVRPMFEGDVNPRSPLDIAKEINPNIEIIPFELDDDADEPPSPCGDINWKVE